MTSVIPAAGTLTWRRREGRLEVALVHRPRYDDWSWPKGKLDPGEPPAVAAVRETAEETGLRVRLGLPLPASTYPILDAIGQPTTKVVHYWSAQVTGGAGLLEHEIDEVAWLDVRAANDRLDYTRDREQLLALVRADRENRLDTWPLVVVRHAKARARSHWKRDDRQRPLDAVGLAQAKALAPVLGAYGITRVVSSCATRCVSTVAAYTASKALRPRQREALTEEAYENESETGGAVAEVDDLLRRGVPSALCSHGGVLPALLEHLATRVSHDRKHAHDLQHATWLTDELGSAHQPMMTKGEALVVHLTGVGAAARVQALERFFA